MSYILSHKHYHRVVSRTNGGDGMRLVSIVSTSGQSPLAPFPIRATFPAVALRAWPASPR